MTNDDELRQRIVDVAAELFAKNGYGGTNLPMVAERAGVTTRAVTRLTGGRTQLFAEVITTKLSSEAADRLAAAAATPEAEPPLAVLLEAAAEIFAHAQGALLAGANDLDQAPAHRIVHRAPSQDMFRADTLSRL